MVDSSKCEQLVQALVSLTPQQVDQVVQVALRAGLHTALNLQNLVSPGTAGYSSQLRLYSRTKHEESGVNFEIANMEFPGIPIQRVPS